jgi:lipoyl(octanoyl) transferase
MSVSASRRTCTAPYLGLVPYERALELQQRLAQARKDGRTGDVLLLLQHPPVFTVGRFRREQDITVPEETLAREGIAVVHTNRGGSITFHGPGQLVGYPILNLKENGLGVREYIARLEETIIKLLLALGIEGRRIAEYPGVWAGEKKICSIGIHASHNITTHGFALNVNNDLRYFQYARPCGLPGDVMTSVSRLLGHPVEMKTVIEKLLDSFSETFCLNCEQESDGWLSTLDARNG